MLNDGVVAPNAKEAPADPDRVSPIVSLKASPTEPPAWASASRLTVKQPISVQKSPIGTVARLAEAEQSKPAVEAKVSDPDSPGLSEKLPLTCGLNRSGSEIPMVKVALGATLGEEVTSSTLQVMRAHPRRLHPDGGRSAKARG